MRWAFLPHHHFRNEADYETSRQRFEFSKTGEDAPCSDTHYHDDDDDDEEEEEEEEEDEEEEEEEDEEEEEEEDDDDDDPATHKLSSSSGFPVTVVFSDLSKVKSKASSGEAEINFFYTKNITEFSDHAATPSQLPPRRCGWWLS